MRKIIFSQDGVYFAAMIPDQGFRIWRMSDKKEMYCRDNLEDYFMDIAISPDGKYLVTANTNNTIKIWDVSTGKICKSIKLNTRDDSPITCLKFASMKNILATQDGEGIVCIIELSDPNYPQIIQTFKFKCYEYAISPDGTTIASAEDSKVIKIRDVLTGMEQLSIKTEFQFAIDEILFSYDGTMLIAFNKRKIIMWKANKDKTSED